LACKQKLIEKALSEAFSRLNILRDSLSKLLTAKHEQETAENNLLHRRDVMAVFPTGFGKSMIFTVFHCSRSPDKNVVV